MKRLNQLVLTGIFSILPFVSLSPNKFEKYSFLKNKLEQYIPLEEKLRKIEKDSVGTSSSGCMHKSMRYYINAKEAGEDAYLIVGWRPKSKFWHAWVGIKKNNQILYVDPAYNNPNIDGMFKEFYTDRKEIYIFDSNTSIEEFVEYKNIKTRNRSVQREFKKKVKIIKGYKKELKLTLTKSITKYCKQDTAAWKYYQEHIAKNKE